jgi:hypothetical protein
MVSINFPYYPIIKLFQWGRYQRLQLQYFIEGKKCRINQAKVDKLLSIGINDPAPRNNGNDEDPSAAVHGIPMMHYQTDDI